MNQKKKKRLKRKVGKIADEIARIQVAENMTLTQLFEKYPHLEKLQFMEMKEEATLQEAPSEGKKLLFD